MQEKIKSIIREITPPIVLHGIKAITPSKYTQRNPRAQDGEKAPEWYDESFERIDHRRRHYSESNYYFLWSVIADRVVRANVEPLLDIGCGPGQLACLLRDKGISNYSGFDFSPKRIEHAKSVCPEFKFSVHDAFKTDIFTRIYYNGVICTEFLEHVEEDIKVIKKIRSGVKFYGTVPNFPFMSHVRHFNSEEEVRARYRSLFVELRVDTFLADANNKKFYLLEGITV